MLKKEVTLTLFSLSSVSLLAIWFAGWLVRSLVIAKLTIGFANADSILTAAITVMYATRTLWATIRPPGRNRHNRCCQCNNSGEEGETHCLVEV
ncbi:hypothetical protein BDR07DRAFT_1392917, partial [Suillus spraguei]